MAEWVEIKKIRDRPRDSVIRIITDTLKYAKISTECEELGMCSGTRRQHDYENHVTDNGIGIMNE